MIDLIIMLHLGYLDSFRHFLDRRVRGNPPLACQLKRRSLLLDSAAEEVQQFSGTLTDRSRH